MPVVSHYCSVPHRYEGELVEFVCFASKQLHQLCKDLKLSGLVYQVGKEFTCKYCSEENFFEVASQEQDPIPQMELKGECDSCSCAVSIEELLSQDLEQMNDKLSEYTTACVTRTHTHTHTHTHTESVSVCLCLCT